MGGTPKTPTQRIFYNLYLYKYIKFSSKNIPNPNNSVIVQKGSPLRERESFCHKTFLNNCVMFLVFYNLYGSNPLVSKNPCEDELRTNKEIRD